MEQGTVVLTGHDLSFEQIEQIAVHGYKVRIAAEGMRRLEEANSLVERLSRREKSVYGLNTGVGWNKDRKVDQASFEIYNQRLLRSHMVGLDPECDVQEIRAILAIRLNGFLCGCTGVSPEIAGYYAEFLNRNIHPVIKKRGSVGAADIGTLPAIGLAIIGEGGVIYRGERMDAGKALELSGLKVLALGPKDGLSIVSSNAQSAAFAALAVIEAQRLLELHQMVYCLTMEGFNGVADPMEERVNLARGYDGQIRCSRKCREYLEGSYLFKPHNERALQDPLSFRSHCAVTGAVLDAVEYLKKQLSIEINTADDNPCLLPEEDLCFGSANFEPLSWVLGLEMVGIALNHISRMICNRLMRLADPALSKLPRFLSADESNIIAYSTVQKPLAALDSENRMYANPSSVDFQSLAGNIEDHGSNAGLAAEKVRRIIDNLYYMTGIELMHGAQALDLRKPDVLGRKTGELYERYRQVVPHLEDDRNLSVDIHKSYDFLKSYEIENMKETG